MPEISSNKRIVKNTLALYVRMMLLMVISLYTSRVNFSVLGIMDNGIWQIVSGTVSAFLFLNGALSGATSRFLTFELGKGDKERLKSTFSAVLSIHIALAILILILSETVGVWLLENKLVIPDERMNAARIAFQFSILACMLSVVEVPYNSSLISHENMNVFAYMGILQAVLNLAICFLLYISPIDKLVCYAILTLIVNILIQSIYMIYCRKHYEECRFNIRIDKEIAKPILGFSTWSLYGYLSVMGRSQGVNIILNMFFGPIINSACGFSNSVSNAVRGFGDNFLTAIKPSIVKTYSIKDYKRMEALMIDASKYGLALMLLMSSPFFFESKYILNLWLKTPPEYTDIFIKWTLATNLFRMIFCPISYAIDATGHVRGVNFITGTALLFILPITYLFLKLGYSPIVPFITDFIIMALLPIANCILIKHLIPEFHLIQFIVKSVFPTLSVSAVVIGAEFAVMKLFSSDSFQRLFVICCVSFVTTGLLTYFLLIKNEDRRKVLAAIKARISRKNTMGENK